MKRTPVYIVGVPRMVILGSLGVLVGTIIAASRNPLPLTPRDQLVPPAYRVAKIPGGTPLRLAMVHDVLHERYLRHGSAWYIQRNKDARSIIAQSAPIPPALPSTKYLDAMDDLAIGLQSLGQFEEATSLMRKKLALVSPLPPEPATQPASNEDILYSDHPIDAWQLDQILAAQNPSPLQHHQYTTCANLGTILVHGAMAKAIAGDSDARAQVREGLAFIRRAIGINPGAHFGRETWQAIAIEDLLAAMDHPDLLGKYDLIGDSLGDTSRILYNSRIAAEILSEPGNDTNLSPFQRVHLRRRIGRIGSNPEWAQIVHPDFSEPMPFDEPTLAIIGMWTLGGGPSPHFALTLATIMEQLGQREIAWNAYERAVEMQDRFWPDPAVRAAFVEKCRDRQSRIASFESPSDPLAWQDKMRSAHQRELAWGQAYQKAYQDYEASQIAAGVPLDKPDFYKPFFDGRPPIASPPGLADDVILTRLHAGSFTDVLPCMILMGGFAMFVGLLTDSRSRKNVNIRNGGVE